jgi:pimeloyl-ACP methyl ester carboxylesterase
MHGVLAALAWIVLSAQSVPSVHPEGRMIFDSDRNRNIPVLIYAATRKTERPLVILSHGKGIAFGEYSFIASALTERGYVVVSIQHDLPGDPAAANTGNISRDRTPGWRSQVLSILRVTEFFAGSREFQFSGKPILIGHSNGGDASMMAARDHPNSFSAVMSLDNRRFALPRTSKPRICSLRSSDQPADPGVLPMQNELVEFSIPLTFARDLRHDDMWDGASKTQKTQVLDAIWSCLTP